MFWKAQGGALDIDHGTYPYVTSSTTTVGAISSGAGFDMRKIDQIIGVVKVYTTRVGAGPFPTELSDSVGEHLAEVGKEKGATTGRQRRCGWLDVPCLRHMQIINGMTGLCLTKLDVLDDLPTIKICTGYAFRGQVLARLLHWFMSLQNAPLSMRNIKDGCHRLKI